MPGTGTKGDWGNEKVMRGGRGIGWKKPRRRGGEAGALVVGREGLFGEVEDAGHFGHLLVGHAVGGEAHGAGVAVDDG